MIRIVGSFIKAVSPYNLDFVFQNYNFSKILLVQFFQIISWLPFHLIWKISYSILRFLTRKKVEFQFKCDLFSLVSLFLITFSNMYYDRYYLAVLNKITILFPIYYFLKKNYNKFSNLLLFNIKCKKKKLRESILHNNFMNT